MSSSTNASAAALGAPGFGSEAAITSSLIMILIVTTGSAFLVPIAISLFFFSTSSLRRKPIFFLNVISILSGITLGILNIYSSISIILGKAIGTASFITACAAFEFFCIFFSDATLLVRVWAVYPPTRLPRRALITVYGPIVIMKTARIVNEIIMLVELHRILVGAQNSLAAGAVGWTLPCSKIEWFLATFDTAFTSALFLLRLYRAEVDRSGHSAFSYSRETNGRDSYLNRLRTLFWIAVTNFVFPVIFNLAQIVLAFRDPNYLMDVYVFFVNIYVSIIGALLATVWCSSAQWSASGGPSTSSPSGMGSSWQGTRSMPLTFTPGSVGTFSSDTEDVYGDGSRVAKSSPGGA